IAGRPGMGAGATRSDLEQSAGINADAIGRGAPLRARWHRTESRSCACPLLSLELPVGDLGRVTNKLGARIYPLRFAMKARRLKSCKIHALGASSRTADLPFATAEETIMIGAIVRGGSPWSATRRGRPGRHRWRWWS